LVFSALILAVGLAWEAMAPASTPVGRPGTLSAARATSSSPGAAESWAQSDVVQPAQLAKELAGLQSSRPLVVCVGFKFLYDSAHIPGSVLLGPAREATGLNSLESAAQSWPRHRDIVIYCGCCPFTECPNVHPAFAALKRMGFTRLRVLNIPQNFGQDWVQKGLPVEKSASPKGK